MSNKRRRPLLIVILGPTASGKSELAIKLAKNFSAKGGPAHARGRPPLAGSGWNGVEIISADSRQIYQEMNVGTGKLTKKQMAGIPHHLIDVAKPDQEFTLAQYKKLAIKVIKDIQKRNKLPFLVGGTGLYIQAVVDNLVIPQVKPNKKLRNKLEKLTNQELFKRLKKMDSLAAKTIDSHNKRRLVRALEVCLLTKKPFSSQRKKGPALFDVLQIGLSLDKRTLNKKIDGRVEGMIKRGLIEETQKLAKKYSFDLPALSGIGYQEISQYLFAPLDKKYFTPLDRKYLTGRAGQGKISLEKAKELIKLHSWQYSRRQMTWFKKDKRIHWIKNQKQAENLIKNFIAP